MRNVVVRKTHSWLKDEMKFKTKNGKALTLSNIYITLRNTFYYGAFEYPKGGGQWYQGKHTPIITKELFDKATGEYDRHMHRGEDKEFAFTKLMYLRTLRLGHYRRREVQEAEEWQRPPICLLRLYPIQ